MPYMEHELALIRQAEVARRAAERSRLGEIPSRRRTGRIRSLRRTDGSLWVFRLPRRAAA